MGQSSSREAGEEEGEVEMAWGGGDDAQNPSRRQSLYFGPPISPNGQRLNLEADVLFEGSAVPLGHLGLARMNLQPTSEYQRTTTIKSYVNVKRSSVRMERVGESSKYRLSFKLDAEAPCTVNIYYCASEMVDADLNAKYVSRYESLCQLGSEFPAKLGQSFSLDDSRLLDTSAFSAADLNVDDERHVLGIFPVVILVEAHPVFDESLASLTPIRVQSQSTFATLVPQSDGSWSIRVLKQKIMVDGVSYVLQEIYGIDQVLEGGGSLSDDAEENMRECVVCMSDTKDTVVLPCRHMCLCSQCAEQLRFQSNRCPICRQPFHALLQIRIGEEPERDLTMEQIVSHSPPVTDEVAEQVVPVVAAPQGGTEMVNASLVYRSTGAPVPRPAFDFPIATFGQVDAPLDSHVEVAPLNDTVPRAADEEELDYGTESEMSQDELDISAGPASSEDPLTSAARQRESAEERRLRRERRKARAAARAFQEATEGSDAGAAKKKKKKKSAAVATEAVPETPSNIVPDIDTVTYEDSIVRSLSDMLDDGAVPTSTTNLLQSTSLPPAPTYDVNRAKKKKKKGKKPAAGEDANDDEPGMASSSRRRREEPMMI